MEMNYFKKTGKMMVAACMLAGLPFIPGTVSASELQTQMMSVQMESTTLKELFDLIEEKFNYTFLIRNNDINLNERISIDMSNRSVEEILYPAMEDFCIDIVVGKDSGVRSIRLDLPKFTLVGATTRAGLLTAPLRDRFGVVHHLEFYTEKELQTIIMRSADVLNVEIDPQGAAELAKRSRGTPRLANRLLKRVRDFAQVRYDGKITGEVASFALDLLEVDSCGLDQTDRRILYTMTEKFMGRPVGLDTLAAAIGEDAGTIEEVYEPFLIKNGFIMRTPRGRVVTDLTYQHLGIEKEETR